MNRRNLLLAIPAAAAVAIVPAAVEVLPKSDGPRYFMVANKSEGRTSADGWGWDISMSMTFSAGLTKEALADAAIAAVKDGYHITQIEEERFA